MFHKFWTIVHARDKKKSSHIFMWWLASVKTVELIQSIVFLSWQRNSHNRWDERVSFADTTHMRYKWTHKCDLLLSCCWWNCLTVWHSFKRRKDGVLIGVCVCCSCDCLFIYFICFSIFDKNLHRFFLLFLLAFRLVIVVMQLATLNIRR